jgi:hypothetical protein
MSLQLDMSKCRRDRNATIVHYRVVRARAEVASRVVMQKAVTIANLGRIRGADRNSNSKIRDDRRRDCFRELVGIGLNVTFLRYTIAFAAQR